MFNPRNFFFRKLFSICFRLILLLLATWIVASQRNLLELWIYLLILVTYVLIYLWSVKADRSSIRIFNDAALIGIVLIGKDISILSNFVFLSLPLVNAPNHSGKNDKSTLFYLVQTTILVVIMLDSYFRSAVISLEAAISYSALSLIFFISNMRKNREDESDAIEDRIEGVAISEGGRKAYNFYKPIINYVNEFESWVVPLPVIDNIICLSMSSKNNLWLVNSSNYILEYRFKNHDTIRELIQNSNNSLYESIDVNIDGIHYKNAYLLTIKI